VLAPGQSSHESETMFYISSLAIDAAGFAQLIRSHAAN
jgi:hypothetical protein